VRTARWDRICLPCRRALAEEHDCVEGHDVRPIDGACVHELFRRNWDCPAQGRSRFVLIGVSLALLSAGLLIAVALAALVVSDARAALFYALALVLAGAFTWAWWRRYPRTTGRPSEDAPGRPGVVEAAEGDAWTTWFLAADGTTLLVAGAGQTIVVRLDDGDLVRIDGGALEAGGRGERAPAEANLAAIAPALLARPAPGWPLRAVEPAAVRVVEVRAGDRVAILGELIEVGRESTEYRRQAGTIWRCAGVPRLRVEEAA
jgi:hypothetical protein